MTTNGVQKSSSPCPTCLLMGVGPVSLTFRPGSNGHRCIHGHVFNDSVELQAAITEARARFPEHYPKPATTEQTDFSSLPPANLDRDQLMRLSAILGVPITGGPDLVGAVFSLHEDKERLSGENEAYKRRQQTAVAVAKMKSVSAASAQSNPDGSLTCQVVVPEWAMSFFDQCAVDAGETVPQLVQRLWDEFVQSYTGMAQAFTGQ